ncbi:hypothetical protein [Herbaspirillum sp. ST 5-3]|uniref:hypothetical protein n=1 Tax=Oxalobacteraceae TaxID=75682 RepID=UPI0010A364FE|nr:hypothetical protein [Herbaspirillum sp. ST 5-3]
MIWTSQTVMNAVKALYCPRGCVKHDAIVKHTSLSGKQVADACAKLVAHGYMKRETYADDTVKPGCYTLTALGRAALEEGARLTSGPKGPTGKTRPRTDTLRDRAWRALRIRRKASVPELIGVLLDAGINYAEVKRAQNNLHKYFALLTRAGYLAQMRRDAPQSPTSNGAKRFLLVRDTGPLPPIPQVGAGKVFDQNEEKPYDIVR